MIDRTFSKTCKSLVQSIHDHAKILPSVRFTLYWLPKLHNKPNKSKKVGKDQESIPSSTTLDPRARLIANSSSYTTTKLSKLLTLCLTAVKYILSSTVKRYMRDPVKIFLDN